jgi:hypothetical protein
MGWDKQANRYDLHPIVRGVVWAALAPEAKRGIYRELHGYFDATPRPPEWEKVESLEDLTPTVELFDKLIGLERYEDAFVFRDHLSHAMLYRLSASRLQVELLERLFPEGLDAPPRLHKARELTWTLNSLALAYLFSGEPGQATPLFRRGAEIDKREKNKGNLAVGLCNLALALWPSGQLREAETGSRRAFGICWELEDRSKKVSASTSSAQPSLHGARSLSPKSLCAGRSPFSSQKPISSSRVSLPATSPSAPSLARAAERVSAARPTSLGAGAHPT